MASLLDTIRNNLGAQATQQAGMTGQTGLTTSLLNAKSGKQVQPGDVASSNLGEASAVDQTRLGQQQLAQQGQLQSAQIASTQQGIQQQEQTGRAANTLQQRGNQIQNQVQTNQLLQQVSQDKATLGLDKDNAALEQLGQNLALQDKQYVDQLNNAGQMNRLNDQLSFQTNLQKSVFADNIDLLNQDITEKAATQQDMAALSKSLAGTRLVDMINADYAQGKAAQTQSRYAALGKIGGAGAMAAAGSGSSSGSSTGNSTSTNGTADNTNYGDYA